MAFEAKKTERIAIQENSNFKKMYGIGEFRVPAVNPTIKDLTTYIDPQKYIEIFADTSIDSQNFWVQTVVQATRRGNYSAKQVSTSQRTTGSWQWMH